MQETEKFLQETLKIMKTQDHPEYELSSHWPSEDMLILQHKHRLTTPEAACSWEQLSVHRSPQFWRLHIKSCISDVYLMMHNSSKTTYSYGAATKWFYGWGHHVRNWRVTALERLSTTYTLKKKTSAKKEKIKYQAGGKKSSKKKTT